MLDKLIENLIFILKNFSYVFGGIFIGFIISLFINNSYDGVRIIYMGGIIGASYAVIKVLNNMPWIK